jgi:hypothetical protein
MLRRILLTLVCAQFVLLVAFAVLVGGFALAAATSDSVGALVLWWTAMGCLMLIVTDALLLVSVLGIAALVNSESSGQSDV